MEVKFTKEQGTALLNYLASKPYAEVYQFIPIISSQLQETKVEEKKDDNSK